ncbi:MAG TPA: hypothetical protein VE913_21450, partial [Longimicrobium sp.]|nr:hypothetical protein [Longimicrobium sp.]
MRDDGVFSRAERTARARWYSGEVDTLSEAAARSALVIARGAVTTRGPAGCSQPASKKTAVTITARLGLDRVMGSSHSDGCQDPAYGCTGSFSTGCGSLGQTICCRTQTRPS